MLIAGIVGVCTRKRKIGGIFLLGSLRMKKSE